MSGPRDAAPRTAAAAAAADDLPAEALLLEEAVRAAGPIAMRYFGGKVVHWEKNPGDPVSEADHAVDEYLRLRLTGARPGYGWLSEETEDDPARLDRARVFVVDPIDGTRSFLRRLPEFTICAGMVEHGRTLAAAIFNPTTDEMFTALAGGGARLNGEPIHVSDSAGFAGARLLSGRRIFERAGWSQPPAGASFHSINSIAYRMALVAAGRYDACISLGWKSDWDVAAADLVVAEAGGRVSTARGERLRYNGAEPLHPSVISAGPALHAAILDLLDGVTRPADVDW